MPNCQCGNPVEQQRVLKEGPNKGKLYYRCATNTCKFFKWADWNSFQKQQSPQNFKRKFANTEDLPQSDDEGNTPRSYPSQVNPEREIALKLLADRIENLEKRFYDQFGADYFLSFQLLCNHVDDIWQVLRDQENAEPPTSKKAKLEVKTIEGWNDKK